MNPALEETIYCDFITSTAAGAASDADSTPTCEVFEDANDTAILSPAVTKRTSKTGNYRVPVACTAANGFEAGKSYNVVVSATVGGVAAKSIVATFQIRTGSVDAANVTKLNGTNQTGRDIGASVLVGDKTGFSLAVAPPTAQQIWEYATRSLTDKAGFSLTSGERTAIAAAVEVDLIDDMTDGEFMQAIADKLAAEFDIENLTIAAIASAVRTELTAELANLDAPISAVALETTVQSVLTQVNLRLLTSAYTAPNNAAIASAASDAAAAKTAAQAAQTAAEAAQVNTNDLPALIADGAFTEEALANAPAGGGGSSSDFTSDEADSIVAAAVRINAVPGEPTAPVFVIPASDTPGLVNVLCRSGSFGLPKNGTTFGFEFAEPTEFVGDEYQTVQRKTGTTSGGEVLIAVFPNRDYNVWAGPKKIGTVTVPANGGVLKEVSGTLTIEEVE